MTLLRQSGIYDPLLDTLAEPPTGEAMPQDVYPAVTPPFTIEPTDLAAHAKTGADCPHPVCPRLTDNGWARGLHSNPPRLVLAP